MQFWIIHQFNLFGKHNIGFDAHTLCCPQTRTVVGKQCPQTRTSSFEDSGQQNHKKNLYHISCRPELKSCKSCGCLLMLLPRWKGREGKVLPTFGLSQIINAFVKKCYQLLPVSASCCQLLPVSIICCQLLPVATSC